MHAESKSSLTGNSNMPVNSRVPENSRVLVAMSGGVDSSATACLLVRQGYNVAGAYLKLPTFSSASSISASSITSSIVSSSGDGSPQALISQGLGQCSRQDQIQGRIQDQIQGRIQDQVQGRIQDQIQGRIQDQIQSQGQCVYQETEDVLETENVRKICQKLSIPFFCIDDVQQEFQKEVIDYFCLEYLAGRTPNPCIPCNQRIKFGFLLERARSLGFDFLATGHYVSLAQDTESKRLFLQRGKDNIKDQSYFLYTLTQSQLQHTLFPLGDYTKEEVRDMAREFDLPVHDKPESQEICFLPQGDYSGFLRDQTGFLRDRKGYRKNGYLEKRYQEKGTGPILNRSGKVLGYHKGIYSYTIGQRRGLGLYNPSPLYVLAIDPEKNTVTVGEESETYRSELIATQPNWMMIPSLQGPTAVLAQIRYRHKPSPAIISPLEGEDLGEKNLEGDEQNAVLVRFDEPEKSIAPGQSVVFYQADKVLGGGVINRVL